MKESLTEIQGLRRVLIKLMKERERVQFEKGQAAEHNKDLRENSDYDYWLQKEMNLTVRIKRVSAEIEVLYSNKKKSS
ncbi:hypothetical protein ACFL0C_01450 [Patescibacteria group bacterium]